MATIPPFRATVAEVGDRIALVSISGELDLYVENELRAALATAAELGSSALVVDLSGVAFMDSTVCGVLVAEAKRRRREQGQLLLVANGKRVKRVLQVSGIDRFVAVHPTLHSVFQELLLEPV
ncbi:MAG TPA: STAS domain-containing protein [Gaiellaceae bacterium]|nr:STAS domain-containing protein [Gaiellaceae bacterium]